MMGCGGGRALVFSIPGMRRGIVDIIKKSYYVCMYVCTYLCIYVSR
jgi:hypothetical protein